MKGQNCFHLETASSVLSGKLSLVVCGADGRVAEHVEAFGAWDLFNHLLGATRRLAPSPSPRPHCKQPGLHFIIVFQQVAVKCVVPTKSEQAKDSDRWK